MNWTTQLNCWSGGRFSVKVVQSTSEGKTVPIFGEWRMKIFLLTISGLRDIEHMGASWECENILSLINHLPEGWATFPVRWWPSLAALRKGPPVWHRPASTAVITQWQHWVHLWSESPGRGAQQDIVQVRCSPGCPWTEARAVLSDEVAGHLERWLWWSTGIIC